MKFNDSGGNEDSFLCSFCMTSHIHEHCMARKKKRDQRNPAVAQEHGHRFDINVWDVI